MAQNARQRGGLIGSHDTGADPIPKTISMIREITDALDAIENEDARRTVAREASAKFQKAFSNGK
jgi:hypothetical protein